MPRHSAPICSPALSARSQQLLRAQRCVLGPILLLDAMTAARLAQVLAQELAGAGVQQPHVPDIPLHADPSAEQLANEALDALIAAGEAAGIDQILPDRHGVAAAGEPQFDGVPMHGEGTGRRRRGAVASSDATPESVVTPTAGFALAGSAATAVAALMAASMLAAASGWALPGPAAVANSAPKSVVTSMAGFARGGPAPATVGVAAPRPHEPTDRTATPASLMYGRRFPADARGFLNAT